MKRIICLSLFLLTLNSLVVYGQDVEVPYNYKMQTPTDYENYQPKAIEAMKWLLSTPVNQDHLTRLKVNRFVSDWIKGNKSLNLPIRNDLLTEIVTDRKFGYGTDFVVIYLSTLTLNKLSLQDTVEMNELDIQMAGINKMIDSYINMNGQVKSSYLEKLVKLKEKEKLSEWMEKKVIDS